MNQTTVARSDIDRVLRGSQWGMVVQELFTNTIHFPIVLILVELIPEGPRFFSTDPAFYALIGAALLQAYALGTWRYQGNPRPMVGNLIAPGLYTLVEVALEGMEFFEAPRHIAFWGFALALGAIQQLSLASSGLGRAFLVLLENVVRTSILLVGYWVFEAASHPGSAESLPAFLNDGSHVFIALATLLLGLTLGFVNLMAQSYLVTLRTAAGRLRVYSEWLLGRALLNQAFQNPGALALRRQERAILFMDIRGFTRWSERQSPETTVSMLNAYFEAGEPVWQSCEAIKAKPSADEIMLVFPDVHSAACAALELQRVETRLLQTYGLAAGIGVHCGPVVEGIMGSREVKAYDVIGDVVNTAKRICDQAGGGEVLVSNDVRLALGGSARLGQALELYVKGKEDNLLVFPLFQLLEHASASHSA